MWSRRRGCTSIRRPRPPSSSSSTRRTPSAMARMPSASRVRNPCAARGERRRHRCCAPTLRVCAAGTQVIGARGGTYALITRIAPQTRPGRCAWPLCRARPLRARPNRRRQSSPLLPRVDARRRRPAAQARRPPALQAECALRRDGRLGPLAAARGAGGAARILSWFSLAGNFGM